MATNAGNVTAGKPKIGGAVSRAPIGTTLPTDAVTALDSAFIGLGYCSEDGFKNNMGITTQKVKAWGGDVVLNTQTEKTDEFSVTLIEVMNVNVLKTVFGDANVTGTLSDGIAVNINAEEQAEASWTVDMVLKGNTVKRIVIPYGKITAISEITYNDSGAVGYALTISARADDSGNTHYEYLKTVSTNVNLSALTINGCTLSPTFSAGTTTYTTTTTSASSTVTAAAADEGATVVIKNGTTTVTSGSSASWSSGTNTLTVTVTNGGAEKVYTVTVTKS